MAAICHWLTPQMAARKIKSLEFHLGLPWASGTQVSSIAFQGRLAGSWSASGTAGVNLECQHHSIIGKQRFNAPWPHCWPWFLFATLRIAVIYSYHDSQVFMVSSASWVCEIVFLSNFGCLQSSFKKYFIHPYILSFSETGISCFLWLCH